MTVADFIAMLAASVERRADLCSALQVDRVANTDLFSWLRVERTKNVADLLSSLAADRTKNVADVFAGLDVAQEAVADLFVDLSRAEKAAADLLGVLAGLREADTDLLGGLGVYQEKDTADSTARLRAEKEASTADTAADLARHTQQSADAVGGLSAEKEAEADVLAKLAADRVQNVVDVLAEFPAWREKNTGDFTALLSRAEEAVHDLKAALRAEQERDADLHAHVSVAQMAANDLLSSLRVLREKQVADTVTNLARSADATADMLAALARDVLASADARAALRSQAEINTDLLALARTEKEEAAGDIQTTATRRADRSADTFAALSSEKLANADTRASLAREAQTEADLVSFLRVLQQADADLMAYTVFLRTAAIGDVLTAMRLAREVGAADLLTTAAVVSELLVAADLLGDLAVQREKGADLRTYLYAWQAEAARTSLIAQLPLLRPRWMSLVPAGGSRKDIRLWTFVDPITDEVRVGPWYGKELAFRGHVAREGEEPGWGTDAWIELLLDPRWWWKHGRAQVRASLQWRIYDIAKWDVCIDLAQRRFYRRMSNVQALLSRWYGATQVDRLENTDEDWNAGDLTHLVTQSGSVQIPPAGGAKSLTFYADDQAAAGSRKKVALAPHTFGARISPPLDLSIIPNTKTTYLRWKATVPARTGMSVEVALTDGSLPTTWTPAQSGQMIPVISSGMDLTGKVLWVRQKLWGQGRTKTPKLEWLFVSVTSTGVVAGDIRAALGKHVPKAEQIRAKIEILKREGDRSLLRRLAVTEILLREAEHGILTREALAELLAREWEV